MSWKTAASTTTNRVTKHTCGGPAFGRKTPGCPRCDELLAGAPVVRGWGYEKARESTLRCEAIRRHYAKDANGRSECDRQCLPICVRFDP